MFLLPQPNLHASWWYVTFSLPSPCSTWFMRAQESSDRGCVSVFSEPKKRSGRPFIHSFQQKVQRCVLCVIKLVLNVDQQFWTAIKAACRHRLRLRTGGTASQQCIHLRLGRIRFWKTWANLKRWSLPFKLICSMSNRKSLSAGGANTPRDRIQHTEVCLVPFCRAGLLLQAQASRISPEFPLAVRSSFRQKSQKRPLKPSSFWSAFRISFSHTFSFNHWPQGRRICSRPAFQNLEEDQAKGGSHRIPDGFWTSSLWTVHLLRWPKTCHVMPKMVTF